MSRLAKLVGLLPVLLVLAGPSRAQNLDLDELGAALALPYLTGGGGTTLATVTNAKSAPVLLMVDVIDGQQCGSVSFQCALTGGETSVFVFSSQGPSARLDVECTDLVLGRPVSTVRFLDAPQGILFVAVADPATASVVSQDVLFGDAVVVDPAGGGALSFGAIPFQAGVGANDGDKVYHFDGFEYSRFPAALVGRADILFTLDLTVGQAPPPRVRVVGSALGGTTVGGGSLGGGLLFDCFHLGGGATSTFVPQPVATNNDAHDAVHGDANNIRRRAVHGWTLRGDHGLALGQGTTPLVPYQGDQDPVLDAEPR